MYKSDLLFIELKIYFNPRGSNIYSTVCTPDQLNEPPSCPGYKLLGWCAITNNIFIAALMTNCFFTCGRCRGEQQGVKYKLNCSERKAISFEYLSPAYFKEVFPRYQRSVNQCQRRDSVVSLSLYQRCLTRMQYRIPLGQKIRTLLQEIRFFSDRVQRVLYLPVTKRPSALGNLSKSVINLIAIIL